MGCTASVPEQDENDPFLADKRINEAINRSLQLNKQINKKGIKLLLLGAGESGKSTVLKQLKLLHKGGFTDQERLQYSQVIWCDVIQSMKILIVQARNLGIPLDCDQKNSELKAFKHIILKANSLQQIDTVVAGGHNFLNDYVLKYSEDRKTQRRLNSTGVAKGTLEDNTNTEKFNPEVLETELNDKMDDVNETQISHEDFTRTQIAESIDTLWKYDQGIKKCFERSNEFQLEANTAYYFSKVYDFARADYMCNDTDILNGRIKTTGITETNFDINSFKFKVLDAGGQRSERKKWIHCFDNINAILFVVAVSEYDQMLFEDERVNRMHEAMVLFDSLCNSRWFVNTPFILFLNKTDILKGKLKKSPISQYFPGYKGKDDDLESAIDFFEKKFLALNKTSKPIYIHKTCATDTTSMKFVLSVATDLIIEENLRKSGII